MQCETACSPGCQASLEEDWFRGRLEELKRLDPCERSLERAAWGLTCCLTATVLPKQDG